MANLILYLEYAGYFLSWLGFGILFFFVCLILFNPDKRTWLWVIIVILSGPIIWIWWGWNWVRYFYLRVWRCL